MTYDIRQQQYLPLERVQLGDIIQVNCPFCINNDIVGEDLLVKTRVVDSGPCTSGCCYFVTAHQDCKICNRMVIVGLRETSAEVAQEEVRQQTLVDRARLRHVCN